MKNTATNNFSYTGIVKLSLYNGNKKYPILQLHNRGGSLLFDFLANCLIGNYEEAKSNQPNKIMLLNITEGVLNSTAADGVELTEANTSSVSDFIYLLSNPERVYSETACVVRYSFSIAGEYLINPTFNSIGLYTDAVDKTNFRQQFVALCKIDTDALTAIPLSSRLVVDWELNISNNTEKNREAEIYV